MKRISFLILIIVTVEQVYSQELPNEPDIEWDQLIYFGNKVTWGQDKWKNSGELQIRLNEAGQSLFQWQVEYVGTYLLNKNIELVPDLRFTIKPNRYELRPGFGTVIKHGRGRSQFVHQIKGQIDFKTNDNPTTETLRYFPSYSYLLTEKWLVGATSGIYYKFTPEVSDFELFVGGLSAAYIISQQHGINFTMAYMQQKNFATGDYLRGIGIITRLIININRDYKYVPAKYINF